MCQQKPNINPNVPEKKADPPFETLLRAYIRSGLDQSVVELLKNHPGARVNFPTSQYPSPLTMACGNPAISYGVINLLIMAGADLNPDPKRHTEATPLHQACKLEREDVVTLLVRRGAIVTLRDKDEKTPLHYVRFSAAIRQKLLAAGAGKTLSLVDAIQCGAQRRVEELVSDENVKCDVERKAFPLSPLHVALGLTDRVLGQQIARVLASKGANPLRRSTAELPPPRLLPAAMGSDSGFTPLDMAICFHHEGFALELLDLAEEQVKKSKETRVIQDVGTVLQGMRTKKYGSTPLHLAVARRYCRLVVRLLEYGVSVHAAGFRGCTPLHLCAEYGGSDICHLLIKAGADVDVFNHCERGSQCTPLHWACSAGVHDEPESERLELVMCLVEAGADCNAVDKVLGDRPIQRAAQSGYQTIVAFLLSCGAQPPPPHCLLLLSSPPST